MGNSLQVVTTINNLSSNISAALIQKANASTTAKCNITIGSITFTKNTGCSISVQNLCSANSDASLDAVLEAAFKTFNELTTSTQQQAAQIFSNQAQIGTTTNDIKQNFSNYVEQQCNSASTINQNITIQNLDLGECTPNFPVDLKFANSGNASANCVIGVLQKLVISAANQVTNNTTQENSYGLLVMGILGLAGMFAFIIYIWIGKKVLFPSTEEKIRLALAQRADLPWTFLWEMLVSKT